MAMEHDESQETAATFMPVIPRLDRLDRLLQLLEEKHSLSRRDFCGNTCAVDSESNAKTLSSALEEVQRKGTLIDRLVLLENRVLQLSLEMDEGNTSKSSTSTVEVSEMTAKDSQLLSIPKRQDQSPHAPLTAQQMQLLPITPPQESGVAREGSRQRKSKGKKKKVPNKWLGLFRLTC